MSLWRLEVDARLELQNAGARIPRARNIAVRSGYISEGARSVDGTRQEVRQVEHIERAGADHQVHLLLDPGVLGQGQVEVALPRQVDVTLPPHLSGSSRADVRGVGIDLCGSQSNHVEGGLGVGQRVGVIPESETGNRSRRGRWQVVDDAAAGALE